MMSCLHTGFVSFTMLRPLSCVQQDRIVPVPFFSFPLPRTGCGGERAVGVWLQRTDGSVLEGVLHRCNRRGYCLRSHAVSRPAKRHATSATVDDQRPCCEVYVPRKHIRGVFLNGRALACLASHRCEPHGRLIQGPRPRPAISVGGGRSSQNAPRCIPSPAKKRFCEWLRAAGWRWHTEDQILHTGQHAPARGAGACCPRCDPAVPPVPRSVRAGGGLSITALRQPHTQPPGASPRRSLSVHRTLSDPPAPSPAPARTVAPRPRCPLTPA